ncbi:MAG: thiamine phosphate synthase [Thermomicrobium sp.]|nr:thiamine phosphate synthase [Thermomicrobium sp.]MDW8060090.1 thiamine phosphate synthase [Thermomicrobium sp.]
MSGWRGWRLREALRLYVVTDRATARGRPESEIVRAAIAGGATAIQLRWKTGPLGEALRVGRELRALCRDAGVLFVVNDRVDLALVLGADGVHVGVSDLPVAETRRLVGESMVVGFSPETLEQAREAEAAGADYLGVGPVYPTATKPDAGPAVGLEHLARIAGAVRIPVVGIGGITADNAAAVIRAGAVGVAVISAVVGADDVQAAAVRLRQVVDAALAERGR